MEKILYKEIIDEYIKIIEEKNQLITGYFFNYLKNRHKLSKESYIKLNNEFKKYLESYHEYKNIIKFIFINRNIIQYDNAIDVLDMLDENYCDVIPYMFDLLSDYQIASDMRLDYKFNINNRIHFLNDSDKIDYINYIKGFNYNYINNFMINEKVYNIDQIEDIQQELMNNYGEITVPNVNDEKSSLIYIHELVHKALFLNKNNINNDSIIYSDIIPILYKMLFKKENKFCQNKMSENDMANILYNDYQNEPFDEQIRKLENIL